MGHCLATAAARIAELPSDSDTANAMQGDLLEVLQVTSCRSMRHLIT